MVEINLFRNAEVQRELSAGAIVFEEGEPAEHFYGVLSGSVDIVRGYETIETVEAGGIFGEVALLGDNQRAAGAVVAEDAVLAELDEAEFLRLVKLNPIFAISVMRVMAQRLQQ